MTGAHFGHMQMCPKWATRPVNSPVYVLARPFAAAAQCSIVRCAACVLRVRLPCLVGMVVVDELLPGAGRPSRQPFRCQAGCMENVAGGWRCVPTGTPRFAVKKDAGWRGLPGRGGVAARDVAEYCGLCWGQMRY